MDVIDRANDLERKYRESALRARNHCPVAGKMISATHCESCGEPIPEARREAVPGCRYCRDCQDEMDSF